MSKPAANSWTQLLLTDFESNFGPLNRKCFTQLEQQRSSLLGRYFLDFLLCHVIVGPCVILFWRGTWDFSPFYLDAVFFDNACVPSCIAVLLIGTIGCLAIQLLHPNVREWAGPPGTLRFVLVSRVFMFVWGFLDIFFWRGLWDGVNCWIGYTKLVSACTLGIGVIVLIAARRFRSAISAPVGIVIDDPENCVAVATCLSTDKDSSYPKRVLDACLTQIIEAFVVLSWHGTWTLIDHFAEDTFHLDTVVSSWMSLITGFVTCLLLFFVQFPLSRLLNSSHHILMKVMANAAFVSVAMFSTINSFRGVWYLCDAYYLSDHYELSLTTGWAFGYVLLVFFFSGCSLHAGIIPDLPEDEFSPMLIPFYLTTYFYIKETDMLIPWRETLQSNDKTISKREEC